MIDREKNKNQRNTAELTVKINRNENINQRQANITDSVSPVQSC